MSSASGIPVLCFTVPISVSVTRQQLGRGKRNLRPSSHCISRRSSSSLIMSTMLALNQKTYGDLSTFEVSSLPVPTPSPTQVLIKVHAAALNPVDLIRSRRETPGDKLPLITGYDVAGTVELIGSSVTKFTVGDRVFGDIQVQSTGPKSTGSVAEWCISEEAMLAKMPEGTDFVQCAALPVAAGTALQAFDLAELKAGEKVFVSGGAGGVGIHAIQIAKGMFGASEVATTASGGKIELVKDMGADIVVDYKKEDAGEVLKDWADVVLDCTREGEMGKKIGRRKVVSVSTFGMDGVLSFALVPSGELMERLGKSVGDGSLKVVVDQVFELKDGVKAVEYLATGRAKGKIVVKVL